jgi:calcineurin-like phosphoesterase family protein
MENQPNYYFTADTHFNHEKVIEYSARPFVSCDEMNKALVSRWNEKISLKDIVYHLGDFGFTRGMGVDPYQNIKNLLNQLNGSINLILGNHDCQNYNQRILSLFASNSLLREKTVAGQRIIMCHYPMLTWAGKHKGSIMLCGHSHNNLPATRKEATQIGKILDIGVDGNNFYPYSFDEIMLIMDKKPMSPENSLFKDRHCELE